MMTTKDRIQYLTSSGQAPEFLGGFTSEDLSGWLQAELGCAKALDQFISHGPLASQAYAPRQLLHVVSGNTPHAAIQSLFRGLLLGSHNIVKIPSSGLPELSAWVEKLPPELLSLIELRDDLGDEQFHQADAIIAIGSDETMVAIQARIKHHQIFIPHGHKFSIGIVSEDFPRAASLAAKDSSLFDQQGCLSPHVIYVKENKADDARAFAGMLAGAMQSFAAEFPPAELDLSEAGVVRNLRETTRFLAANDQGVELLESSEALQWTVVYEENPLLKLSCLHRCVYVKPLPEKLDLLSLGPEARYLSTIALHPFSQSYAESLAYLPAHRFCPLGQSQEPSLFWHHDGFAPLSSLVNWKDIG